MLSYPEHGSLDKYPVGSLLADIWRHSLSGILDIDTEGVIRRIYVRDGHPVFMQSNADLENVGVLLLQRGSICQDDYTLCHKVMQQTGQTLQQALLSLRLVEKAELIAAHKLFSGQLLPTTIGLYKGTYSWQSGDAFVGQVPSGRYNTLSVVFFGKLQVCNTTPSCSVFSRF